MNKYASVNHNITVTSICHTFQHTCCIVSLAADDEGAVKRMKRIMRQRMPRMLVKPLSSLRIPLIDLSSNLRWSICVNIAYQFQCSFSSMPVHSKEHRQHFFSFGTAPWKLAPSTSFSNSFSPVSTALWPDSLTHWASSLFFFACFAKSPTDSSSSSVAFERSPGGSLSSQKNRAPNGLS